MNLKQQRTNLKKINANFFRRLGANVRDRYREHIFGKAKDVHGKPFKKYSSKYAERKVANKFKRQASNYASSKAPVLTSDLLRDFTLVSADRGGFKVGWASQGAKIKWLKKLGRVLSASNQPLPQGIIQYISSEVRPYINKKLPKGKKTYRIGK